jgi:O-antigen/teichoic acid export membrane protein
LISVILFPITFLGAAAAPELISLLLGPSWSELTPLLRVFLPLAAFLTLAHQVTAILLAINRFEIAFWCTCGLSLGRLFVVCSGMWIGFTAAVYGIALISAVYIAALLVYAAQPTGCSLAALVRDLSGPAISSLVGAVVCTLVLHLHSASTALTFISLAIGAGAFAICMITIDLKSLVEDWRTLRRVLQPAVRGSN